MIPTNITIPKRMRSLPLERGLPVPYIVQRGADGKYLFAVNDAERQGKCVMKKLCPICGQKLTKELWFIGGPRSAFHPHGCYFDSAMHTECLHYALQVCPYLALCHYHSTLEARLPHLQKQVGLETTLMDHTQDSRRPSPFVAVLAYGQSVIRGPVGSYYVRPLRPYQAVEFWQHGGQLAFDTGLAMVLANPTLQSKEIDKALCLVLPKQRRAHA